MKEELENIQKLIQELKNRIVREQRYEHASDVRDIDKMVKNLIDKL